MGKLFSIAERTYKHFSFDAAARQAVRDIVLAIALGILLVGLYTFYLRRVPGRLVREILRAEAFDESRAKTLCELGLQASLLLPLELRWNASLKKLVRTVEGEQGSVRYFIPQELRYRAEIRFDKKDGGVVSLLLLTVLTFVLTVVVLRLIPPFLGIVDALLA